MGAAPVDHEAVYHPCRLQKREMALKGKGRRAEGLGREDGGNLAFSSLNGLDSDLDFRAAECWRKVQSHATESLRDFYDRGSGLFDTG